MNKGKWKTMKKRAKVRGKFKATIRYTTGSVKRNFSTLEQRDGWIRNESTKSTYISSTKW